MYLLKVFGFSNFLKHRNLKITQTKTNRVYKKTEIELKWFISVLISAKSIGQIRLSENEKSVLKI